MAPQPRMAPPPPPPPPPVMAPVAPVPSPFPPRTTSTTGSSGTADTEQPKPADRAPATTGGTGATGGRTTPAAPVAAPAKPPVAPPVVPAAVPSVDRSTALAATTRSLLPARDVAVVSTDGGGRNRTEVRTDDKGQFSVGPLAPGIRDLTFPVAGLQRALSGTATKNAGAINDTTNVGLQRSRALSSGTGANRRLPSVTVSLVLPAAPGAGARGNLVVHTYSGLAPNEDIRARISIPRDGGGAIVDWGDGTPPVDVVRDGWPVNVGGGRGPVDTIGTVSFVRKFEKMGFIQMDPCNPWWQCAPPPDPDPPPLDDPWTEILPEGDPPPEDPFIEIVDLDDPPREDPPREDPPKVDPPQIGDKTFDIGSLRPGIREIRLGLPISDPPRPPVKVALLLPVEPRATVEALNAGGRPPRVGEKDRLHLVEHIYAPDTTAQTLRVRITMAKDGRGALVDWGDGTPITDVMRDGKPIAAASVDREAVGRILFLGPKKKQP